MSTRVVAALFTALFLIGAVPMLLIEPSGSASAGLSAGFMLPLETLHHVVLLVAIGLLSAWFGREAVLLLPLCALLMLAIGGMMQVDEHLFRALRGFIGGAIILFALGVSLLRHKIFLLSIPPIALWIYYVGNNYMGHIPAIATPIFFLLGTVISAALLIAIGVSFGVTLTESVHDSVGKLRTMPAFATLLSFF